MTNHFRALTLASLGVDIEPSYRLGDTKVAGAHQERWLREAYFVERKTIVEIARERGCSSSVVIDALRRLDGYAEEARMRQTGGSKGQRYAPVMNDEIVIQARRFYKQNRCTIAALHAQLNIKASLSSLTKAVLGRTYRHVDAIEAPAANSLKSTPSHKIYDADLIVWMNRQGVSPDDIALELCLDRKRVVKVINRAGEYVEAQRFSFIHKDGTIFNGSVAELIDRHLNGDNRKRHSLLAVARSAEKSVYGWMLVETVTTLSSGVAFNGKEITQFDFVRKDGFQFSGTVAAFIKAHLNGDYSKRHSVMAMTRERANSIFGWTLAHRLADPDFKIGHVRGDKHHHADSVIRSWHHSDGRRFEGTILELRSHACLRSEQCRHLHRVANGHRDSAFGWKLSVSQVRTQCSQQEMSV